MMRIRTLLFGCAAMLFAFTLVSGEARAISVSFGDSTRYWPGYANGTGDDTRDTIGTPDFSGGVATFEGGRLTDISLSYTGHFSLIASGAARVIPGDLFLDIGGDGHWDYVVKLVGGAQTPVASYASLAILDVSAIGTPSYLMTGSDNTGYWQGYGIRDRHPYAWNGGGTQIGVASLGAYDQVASGGTLSFDLGAGISVSSNVTIGFAPSCANDVVRANVTAPTPEPTAALVFAVGLAAVARTHRKPRARR